MKAPSEIGKILQCATKAPSGHNTQPWKFLIKKDEIQIHPDFNRALPIVDSDNHALYISLGCAVENAVLTAKNYGFSSNVKIVKNYVGADFITINLLKDKAVEVDELFNYIDNRQVTRNEYSNSEIPSKDVKLLLESFDFEGVHMLTFTDSNDINELEPFIIEGSNLQFQNKDFVNELVSWIRFSRKEVEQKRDGIWHASMGMPSAGRLAGNIIMKKFVSAKSEAKRWKKQIKTSASFVLFTVEKNDVEHWVNLGRAFQRFGLTATKLNINHAHVNMPCEELSVRKKMATCFNLKNEHPLLLIRLGYSEKMPYSYRRPLHETIVNEE